MPELGVIALPSCWSGTYAVISVAGVLLVCEASNLCVPV
jgi:hypothetical protein